jgi:acyl-CoA thioesterase
LTLPRQDDLALIPVDFDADGRRGSFLLEPPLLRHDGTMYGGTAIAASVMAMEAATQRDVLWVTTQFVAPAPNSNRIDVSCETLASGKRTAQCRITGTLDGEVMFASLGSTGLPKDGGLAGQFERMPVVSSPDEAEVMIPGPPGDVESPDEPTFRRSCEYRTAEISSSEREPSGTIAMWSRFKDSRPMTPAGIAFCADMVPVAIARAAGTMGAGMSLDNSLRFGEITETEWVLLELQGNMATGGYGHGTVRVWSEDGHLLAIGSQSATMIYIFDEGSSFPFEVPR